MWTRGGRTRRSGIEEGGEVRLGGGGDCRREEMRLKMKMKMVMVIIYNSDNYDLCELYGLYGIYRILSIKCCKSDKTQQFNA